MQATLRERFDYHFEQYLARGGLSLFLLLTLFFMVCLAGTLGLRFLLLRLAPEFTLFESFSDHTWVTFLAMTDPGNMYQDNASPPAVKIATVVAGMLGVVIFSMLIAFITTGFENTLYVYRKGRGKVLEEGHTLILGWNERVIGILRELILANESERHAVVVVLADRPKEEMDDEVIKSIPDSKTTRIITSNGDPMSLTQLRRINAAEAKSVIVLASCPQSAPASDKEDSDTRTVKVLMALTAAQDGANEKPIVAELFEAEKRDLVELFSDNRIVTLNSWDIMGKLFVQTSLTSGLEMVYAEMLSFDGAELYFYEAAWEGCTFGELPMHLVDGIPLGILDAEGQLVLRPPPDRKLSSGDQAVVLAEDDSSIVFKRDRIYSPSDFSYAHRTMRKARRRMLVLGWHDIADTIIHESVEYLEADSAFDVVYKGPSAELRAHLHQLQTEHPGLRLRVFDGNPLTYADLRAAHPFSYDNVIILSQSSAEITADRVDSDTLIILLLLRKIANEENVDKGKTKLITQVLNSENQDLIVQTDVDDFIISNKLITMMFAQLSEEPRMKMIYDDLFQEEGSEIYVKPASLYFSDFPMQATFADVIAQSQKRDEVCLGIRVGTLHKDASRNFGVRLNLPKDERITLTAQDFLVVLSEDEL